LWQLVFADVDATDLDRIGGQMIHEARVDVDRGDVRTAPGHPFDERAAARADLEAFPAGADAEFLEQCAAAAIPQRLHAGKPCPLLGEALVEDVVAGHD